MSFFSAEDNWLEPLRKLDTVIKYVVLFWLFMQKTSIHFEAGYFL